MLYLLSWQVLDTRRQAERTRECSETRVSSLAYRGNWSEEKAAVTVGDGSWPTPCPAQPSRGMRRAKSVPRSRFTQALSKPGWAWLPHYIPLLRWIADYKVRCRCRRC